MKDLNHMGQEQIGQSEMDELGGENRVALNFDIQSYRFHDLDLAMAVNQLPKRDQTILVLHFMGHTQNAIARTFSLSRSMISKRLTAITRDLKRQLNQNAG